MFDRPRARFCSMTLLVVASALVASGIGAAQSTPGARPSAGVDWLEVKSVTDAFGGADFGSIGAYENIAAVAHGLLDPNDPANARIVDLDKAPRVNGLVEYQTDVGILRPKNPKTARRVLFYDVVNRGNKIGLTSYFNEGTGNLATAGDAGNAFLMRQGYTIVWSGWQGDIPMSGDGTRIGADFPVATNADGSLITGQNREESSSTTRVRARCRSPGRQSPRTLLTAACESRNTRPTSGRTCRPPTGVG